MTSCPFTGKSAIAASPTPGVAAPSSAAAGTPDGGGCRFARNHGLGQRNGDEQPTGGLVRQGKFGRMFATLPALRSTDEIMAQLGAAMVTDQSLENDLIPAGFTYLGQFVDHDLTFDTTGLGEQIADPTAISNFRTARLDLDSVYGRGPTAEPQLYQREHNELMQLGVTNTTVTPAGPKLGNKQVKPSLPFDLPRSPQGFAIIGDPRNDENLVVAQTHLAFLRLHNKLAERIKAGPFIRSQFEDARELVQWHYQWVVLHDFVARLTGEAVLQDVLKNGRNFYCFEKQSEIGEPYIPLEFSVAAYRLGHSMVREDYDYNAAFGPGGLTTATLGLLFRFSGLSHTGPVGTDVPIPSNWIIDWNRFYEISGKPANLSMRLDPFLTKALHTLPNSGKEPASLAVRNLQRALKMGLPSAQDVAAFMGVPLLAESKLTSGPDGAKLRELGLHIKTPLWFYILKEAEQAQGGKRLGETGARIVAEVFVGILQGDPGSFLSRNPSWTPTLGNGGTFTMVDLLKFVGDLNPVEDNLV